MYSGVCVAASRAKSAGLSGFRLRLGAVMVCLLLACGGAYAQNGGAGDSVLQRPGRVSGYLGALGGYAYIWNATRLPILDGQNCGNFSDGTASGFFAGISYDYVLLPDFLELSGRALFSRRPAELQTLCINDLEVLDPATNTYVPFEREHQFSAALNYLIIDAGVRVKPLPYLPLYARLSFDVGVPLFGTDFEQVEQIVSPLTVTFPDGTQRRTTAQGELSNAGTAYGALLGIGASIPFQPGLTLEPEIAFRYGINSMVSDAEWKSNMLHLSLGVRWEMRESLRNVVPRPEREEEPEEDEPISSGPQPLVIRDINTHPLEVRETIVTQTIPLLPYLFFDSASADLRTRYRRDAGDKETFRPEDLPRETLSTYYHLLNIIGKRLQEKPAARLSIRGTSDGVESGSREERLALARERAATVAEYLQDEWDIEAERLSIEARELPELASSDQYAEGYEENRRVELYADDAGIFAPVVHSRFKEFAAVNAQQNFSVQVLHEERADSWDLAVLHRGNMLAVDKGAAAPPARISLPVTREALVKLGERVAPRDSLKGELQVVQEDGSVITASCNFPIVKSRNKFELSRLSLIVFDFDRADISEVNRKMMEQFVGEAIRENSVCAITGSTDRLGEKRYNQQLSESRANTVRDYLLNLKPGINIESVKGIGFSSLPYDNNLPEGRYYCRTVALEVRTPID